MSANSIVLYYGFNFYEITLDKIADLNIVEILDRNSALKALRNLFHIVFETFELR